VSGASEAKKRVDAAHAAMVASRVAAEQADDDHLAAVREYLRAREDLRKARPGK
jgi:hypothetical protein